MSKSSRLWWLHGVVLLTAVVGCKSNSGGGMPAGSVQSAPPPMAGGQTFMGSPTGAGTTTMYPAGSPTTPYSGASGGQSFTPQSSGFNNSASPMYSQPGTNTSGGPAFGTR